ncbi:MAG: bifunctional methylenetetrahydrofolate dehydrogenase/methenyltetrahydrofolate cyclohydrolase FolD [Alphaproteobacteria bacterium]
MTSSAPQSPGGATPIDGKACAAALRIRIGEAVSTLKARQGLTPGLAVVLVGDNPASQVYVRNKGIQTREAGMVSVERRLPADTTQDTLLGIVRELNADPSVHGILVQMPLPDHIDTHAVMDAIDPLKDVDGLGAVNAGLLALGRPGLVPCTPQGVMVLLDQVLGSDGLSGCEAVVVGRSILVGKPLAQLLLAANATVTVAHSRTRDLAGACRRADVLVAAVGRPRMIGGDWIKPGGVVIDVGINRVAAPERGEGATRLVGDVDFEAAKSVASAITPVPGGVGPMTIACLLRNTVLAACRQNGIPEPDGL